MAFCRKCGLSMPDDATFCATCGEKVPLQTTDPGQPAETQPQVASPPAVPIAPDAGAGYAAQPPRPAAVVAPVAQPKASPQATIFAVVILLVVVWFGGGAILRAVGLGNSGSAAGNWTTATTLHSSDPVDSSGVLTSEPFSTTNKVRVVFSIPRGDSMDSIMATIVPADKANDPTYFNGEVVSVSKTFETDEISGLNGTYVLQVLMPGLKEWAMEIQTAP
jgi:hypothetical protein